MVLYVMTPAPAVENPDQFSQLNDSVQTAAVIQPRFAGNLTLCGSESETDWFPSMLRSLKRSLSD